MLIAPLLRWLLLASLLVYSGSGKPHRSNHRRRHHHRHPERERGWRSGGEERAQRDGPAAGQRLAEPQGSRPADNATLQGYVRSKCSSCLLREEAKRARIEKIKGDLLEKLGFRQQPSANATQALGLSINEGPIGAVIRSLGFQSDAPNPHHISLDAADSSAKTERVYSFARTMPEELGIPNADGIGMAYFHFSSTTRQAQVTEAELNVYIEPPSSLDDSTPSSLDLKLQIFAITKKGQLEAVPFKTRKVEVNPRFGVWVKVGIAERTQQWFDKPDANFGLHVSALHEGENLAVHPNQHQPTKGMYVEVVTVEGEASRRSRREAEPSLCREGGEESRCCRYPLVIDFEEMGWDWVIAPKQYMAYYCNGACPFKHLQSYIHTHLVSQQGLPEGASGPCCYPTELAPIMMVYMNDQREVLVSKVPSMVANRCGCA